MDGWFWVCSPVIGDFRFLAALGMTVGALGQNPRPARALGMAVGAYGTAVGAYGTAVPTLPAVVCLSPRTKSED